MKRIIASVLLVSVLILALASCGLGSGQIPGTQDPDDKKDPEVKTRSEVWYDYFATVSNVKSFGPDTDDNFKAVTDKVKTMLSEYHKLYDIYFEYTGINNIKTINDNAGIAPVKVDKRIIDLLKFGIEAYELTDGEVNVMMGSVLKLWHDAREAQGKNGIPTDEALTLASMHTSISSLEINEAEGTVFITDSDASLDVGAIAKGYATERIAEALIADTTLTTEGYALNIGGNIRLIGKKNGADFKIGITNPDKSSEEAYATTIMVSDTSIVTSGDYERYFTVDGKNYHHVIDKDTLQPSTYFHSVTVVTKDGALADALTTALFSMHINDGHALVESIDGVEALWIGTNGTTVKSTGFPEAVE